MSRFIKVRLLVVLCGLIAWVGLCSCKPRCNERPQNVILNGVAVSVCDQRLAFIRQGKVVKSYPVSTSKFGLGDGKGSCRTPLGKHIVSEKIGEGRPMGTVFRSRRPTGEVLPPNAPGRDPIVTRILWLHGVEPHNKNAKDRMIYVHGTAEERTIGQPASFGCIRMRSRDVVDFYNRVRKGDYIVIERTSMIAIEKAAKDHYDAQAQAAKSAKQ